MTPDASAAPVRADAARCPFDHSALTGQTGPTGCPIALPPEISHMTVWSPITPERKLDDEEAIYRGANHWLPA